MSPFRQVMNTFSSSKLLRLLLLSLAVLLSGCSPQWQCYLQKKVAIDAVYRPRMQQLRFQAAYGQISPQNYQKRAIALENEWNNRLEYEQQKCFGTLPKNQKRSKKPASKPATEPKPANPVQTFGEDPIRVNSYKEDAVEIKPADLPTPEQ